MTAQTAAGPMPDLRSNANNPIRRLWDAKPWMAAIFMVTSFVYGVALFVLLVTLIAVGAGLSITLIGIPILALALGTWVGAAIIERRRIALFLGERIQDPYRPRPEGSLWTKTKAVLRDPAIWKDLVYDLLLFPIGVAEFVIVTVAVFFPLQLLTLPLYYWIGDGASPIGDVNGGPIWRVDTLAEALAGSAAGLVVIIPAMFLVVAVARGHLMAARWFLGSSREEELEERVEVLTKTRSDVMEAMMLERRRIERDLHDGAQQRLVSLAMNLGMAKEKLESDPDAAKELVETSHDEAKQVLKELRELVQGIHPAVLTDRGLDAAISAIAGRSPVPITVEVDLPVRPPEAVESTAYFVVAEALTNIAKHSGATQARVTVWQEGDDLRLIVWDNGRGGAAVAEQSGLAGLIDRVAALDGRLTVQSPPDRGTRIEAVIPCAS